jgi:hypothetical protein
MKISKKDALDLVKVLTHYQTFDQLVNVDVRGLCQDLEEFVLERDGEDDYEEDERDDEEVEEDDKEKDEEELDEQEDGESDEDDGEGEEDDGEGEAAYVTTGVNLSNLKRVKARVISTSDTDFEVDDPVTISFESDVYSSDVNLIVETDDLRSSIGPISYVKRMGSELHVAEGWQSSRTWHRFGVSKFPKGWATELPLDELVEVEQ